MLLSDDHVYELRADAKGQAIPPGTEGYHLASRKAIEAAGTIRRHGPVLVCRKRVERHVQEAEVMVRRGDWVAGR